MGFADGLGRFLSGKPAFDAPDSSDNGDQSSTNVGGDKYLPQVVVTATRYALDGDNMTCSVTIKNQSNVEVMLDKIRLINTVKELDASLKAEEEKEFLEAFKGPRPKHDSYSDCQLEYRDTTGDYFKTMHYVEYTNEPDGTYSLRRMRFLPPVRDV